MRSTYSGTFHQNRSATRAIARVRPTASGTKPPRYKMFLLTWLAIYPLITTILLVFGSWLNAIPLLPRTLLLTGVLVYLMTYVVMPKMTKIFHQWLSEP